MDQLNDNPFELLTTPKPSNGDASNKLRSKVNGKGNKQQFENNLKERMTIQISKNTIERVKDAVYWTPGLTVAQLTEEALEIALERLEKKNGKPFEKRKSELKPGRPLK
jgi:hypothetical protein